MKPSQIKRKEKERQATVASLRKQIYSGLTATKDFSEEEIQEFLKSADQTIDAGLSDWHFMLPKEAKLHDRLVSDKDLFQRTLAVMETLPYEKLAFAVRENFAYLLDSEKKHFHGDVVITDPCYVLKDEDWDTYYDEVEKIPALPHSMARDTIYGDWSCHTFNTDTKQPIGQFCTDSGTVGVFELSEVLAYNPKFDYHTERPWTTTVIKNFDGNIQFIVKQHKGVYGDNYSVHVVGTGIDFTTGLPLNFITRQTGL